MAVKQKIKRGVQRGGTQVVSFRLNAGLVASMKARAAAVGVRPNRLVALVLDEYLVRLGLPEMVQRLNATPPVVDLFD